MTYDAIRLRHTAVTEAPVNDARIVCTLDRQVWPCDAIVLLVERARILAAVEALPGVLMFGERILYQQFVDRAAVIAIIKGEPT